MNPFLPLNEADLAKEKKKDWLFFGFITGVGILAILLMVFLHPRSETSLYMWLSILVFVLMVFLDYYFVFYRYLIAKSYENLLSQAKNPSSGRYVFLRKEEGKFSRRRLSYVHLIFLDESKKEVTLSLLSLSEASFEENKEYVLKSSNGVIVGAEG